MTWSYYLFLFLASLGGALLAILWLRYRYAYLRRKALRKAKAAEEEAVFLLEEVGFKVLARQPLRRVNIMIDGKRVGFEIRPDFLLKKGRKLYVGEVKSGKGTAFLFRPSVRRQLLEYFFAYRPHGVVLVDGERKEIHQVLFPGLFSNVSWWRNLWMLFLGMFLGVLFGSWVGGT